MQTTVPPMKQAADIETCASQAGESPARGEFPRQQIREATVELPHYTS
tara:strand:- start:5177 stop:5320 length:144 start_codon:yes stop_codon:yes gene_type:complete